MHRRQFITTSAAAGGLALFGSLRFTLPALAQTGPYGPLGDPDNNGLRLPVSFTSRVVATTGERVDGTDHVWHPNPDGGATFAHPDGGWVYVSNDESGDFEGGVSMVRFDGGGSIVEARPILVGTNRNCAGGATPWGTWLSCEEFSGGQVWECDPFGVQTPELRPDMGVFQHEAAACDHVREVVYLTEDRPDGGLYRFVPDRWGELSNGDLEVLADDAGALVWRPIPDPSASQEPTREQVASMIPFAGGEGAWFDGTHLYFTTKGDNRVWRLDPETNALTTIYEMETASDPVLSGVDNVTMSAGGDLYVCEDGGNMEIVLLTPEGQIAPFLRLDQDGSELTGVAFDPSGSRMYFSSQRKPGRTYEISGPFRTAAQPAAPPPPPPTPAAVTTVPRGAGTHTSRAYVRWSETTAGPSR